MFESMARAAGGARAYQFPGALWSDGSADNLSKVYAGVGTSPDYAVFSAVIQRIGLGTTQVIFNAYNGSIEDTLSFNSSDQIVFTAHNVAGTVFNTQLITTQVFRDTTSAYHIVMIYDSLNSTASDRVRLYVNGVRITAFGTATYPGSGQNLIHWNTTYPHRLLAAQSGAASPAKVVVSELVFLDGTTAVVDATSFGEFDANGVWRLVNPGFLTFGNNGFRLDFGISASLGADVSGNNNTWTLNSITSANASNNVLSDPLPIVNVIDEDAAGTIATGGTSVTGTTHALLNVGISSGKYAWKLTTNATASFGIEDDSETHTAYSATNADVLEFELDVDAGTLKVRVNGAAAASVATGLTTQTYYPYMAGAFTLTQEFTPADSTFTALKLGVLSEPTIPDSSQQFKILLYTGNGVAIGSGGNAIAGLNFSPDLVIIKNRDTTDDMLFFNTVRGATKYIRASTASLEFTNTEGLTSFNSDGFTVGSHSLVNTNAERYAAWCMKLGGASATNSDGTISAAASANALAGFSVVAWTGTGVNATIGHGLGKAPALILVKKLTTANAHWAVYHEGVSATPAAGHLVLSTTAALSASTDRWNSTVPTTSVFSIGTNDQVNASGESYVAFCFANIEGFSKSGYYLGNGSADGPLINLGFRPAFFLLKPVSLVDSWILYDAARNTYNPVEMYFTPDTAIAEATGGTNRRVDFLASGIKMRSAHASSNTSGSRYVYIAIAEIPSGGANATPAPAR